MKGKATLQLVRNATLKLDYAGRTILVDPVLAEKGTLMSALGVNRNPRVHLTMPVSEVTKGVDTILLTHNHIDHYEPGVRQHLPEDILFLVQPQDKEAISADGFTNVQPIGEETALGELRIRRIGGHHGFGKLGKMMGPVSGYLLRAEGYPAVFLMGDCCREEKIMEFIEKEKPDYTVVNSGGAVFPELSKDFGAIIPDECDVIRMMEQSPAQCKFIAVHMDAIDHCQTTRAILRNEARHRHADPARLLIPEDGETIAL